MNGVELFAGVGGMSLGAQMAGINVKLAIEIDPSAAKTYKQNHKNTSVKVEDVRNISCIDMIADGPTILMGGPPCQGFSYSNQKTRNLSNDKNWLFTHFVRLARQWKPDWVVLENVSGIVRTEKGFFLKQIMSEFESIGYTISYKILNAADYGVPQTRQRFFLVGSLHGIKYEFPEPTILKHVTVSEALDDLPELSNGDDFFSAKYSSTPSSAYAKKMRGKMMVSVNNSVTKNSKLIIDRYKHIPQGGNWKNIPSQLMDNYKDHTRCHTGIYHRLDETKPSTVIGNYRKNMLIHPIIDRGLSVREAARLQSFPDWFEFTGSIGEQQQQVGNAVPPLLAEAVFKQILRY